MIKPKYVGPKLVMSVRPNGIEYLKVVKTTKKSYVGYVCKLSSDGKILSLPRKRRVAKNTQCVIVDSRFVVNQLQESYK